MDSRSSHRRQFLRNSALGGAGILLASNLWADDRPLTAEQTSGPFYPIPEIKKQPFYDADLTRKAADGPLAEGEIIVVRGQVLDVHGDPLANSIVEVWQACEAGRYNHPQDDNPAPLDPNFQYFARIETDKEGKYSFKSIRPGKYPGRTPHIHLQISAKGLDDLTTQMYFAMHAKDNEKDGIYRALNKSQRESVTVDFAKDDKAEGHLAGDFTIVLGARGDKKATPPM
jgi:protocatechuate 3,4-dioxygenase, beta subunit